MSSPRPVLVPTVAVLLALLVAAPTAAIATTDSSDVPAPRAERPLTTVPSLADPDIGRREVPEDEHAMALGCYELTNVASAETIGRDGAAYAPTATPFHFEPTELATYLLLDPQGDLVSAEHGPAEMGDAALTDAEYVTPADRTTHPTRTFEGSAPDPVRGNASDHAPTVDTHTGAVVPGSAGPSAEWRAHRNDDGSFTFISPAASGRALAFVDGALQLADAVGGGDTVRWDLRAVNESGCAEWPEIEVNVEGPVLAGATPWDETRGTIDAHLHLMAYEFLGGEFRCGRPWHRYGVTVALRDCAENEFAGGRLAEATFGDGPDNYGDDVYWPEFTVPTPRSKTYEQVYYRWLERAWRGGLRMMTVLLVENNSLCETWPDKRNSCNEMDSVRLQARRLQELVDYIDARSGGPGEGWAQIARDPFEAREIVNQGKLAFVMGIEVSVLFECREFLGTSQCSNADIVRSLDEIEDMGVVQLELVNKFDNALSGVKGDAGIAGVVVNQGNLDDTGHYWKMDTCPEDRDYANDRHQISPQEQFDGSPGEPVARDPLAAEILSATGTSGVAPLYPEGPHCNIIGLTSQGEFTLREMARRGLLFDPDHMSALGAKQGLDVMEELGYSGIVSSHGWADDLVYERIYDLGGTVTPYAGSSGSFLDAYYKHRSWADDRYYWGIGYGADTNGLGGQGSPRNPDEDQDVDYPFTAPGGALVSRQVSGVRDPYDINTDGVAHYGLYPDWIEDLRVMGGDEVVEDLLRGPEAYLQVWERAVGVPKDACIFGDGSTDPTEGVHEGMTFDEVLLSAGQPHVRDADGYTYCGVGPNGDATHVVVSFDGNGHVDGIRELPATTPLPPLNPPREGAALTSTVSDETAGDPDGVARTHANAPAHDHRHAQGHARPERHDVTMAAIATTAPARMAPVSLLAVAGTALLLCGLLRRGMVGGPSR